MGAREPAPALESGAWESTVNKDVLVGQQVGEYVVRRRIGSGGMGVVYEGEHPVIGRKVAIKVLRQDTSEGMRARELVGEARAASAIRHRGIIDIFGFGTIPGIGQYLVMEFLNGRPLDEVILDRAPMQPTEAIRLLTEMLGALAAAHAEGVIHRDLKPGNIFVVLESNGSEYVKVLDFGLAKQGVMPHGATPQTRASMIVGTPEYMAPEQACGQPVSPRTDLYAVGIILFEMLTGRLPFRGDSPMHVAIQQVQAQPPSPSSFVDGLPPALDALILRLLAKDAEQRPASADVVARELKAISRTLAADMTQLSGFARNLSESAPGSAPSARPQQGRGGTRQPGPPAPQDPLATGKTLSSARARTLLAPAPDAAPTTMMAPVSSSAGDLAFASRSGPGRKPMMGAGLAAVLLGAGVAVWARGGDDVPAVPSVSATPAPTPPKQEPRPEAVAQRAPVDPPPTSGTPAPPETPAPQTVARVEEPAPDKAPLKTGSGAKRGAPVLSGSGSLQFISLCWAEVFVDGQPRGRLPGTNVLSLSAGRHRLELRKNEAIENPRKDIVIRPGGTTVYEVRCASDG